MNSDHREEKIAGFGHDGEVRTAGRQREGTICPAISFVPIF